MLSFARHVSLASLSLLSSPSPLLLPLSLTLFLPHSACLLCTGHCVWLAQQKIYGCNQVRTFHLTREGAGWWSKEWGGSGKEGSQLNANRYSSRRSCSRRCRETRITRESLWNGKEGLGQEKILQQIVAIVVKLGQTLGWEKYSWCAKSWVVYSKY